MALLIATLASISSEDAVAERQEDAAAGGSEDAAAGGSEDAAAGGSEDGYIVYLSRYLDGDYYVAALGDVDVASPPLIKPRKLRLPRRFRNQVEIGNHDVSPDGRTIIFAATSKTNPDWNIYQGSINLARARITAITRLIGDSIPDRPTRDEDPKFSWDGSQIVYKCDFDICVHGPQTGLVERVATSPCELWSPSFDRTGYSISYTQRGEEADGGCDDDPRKDRIWLQDLTRMEAREVPLGTVGGGPDRFAHYLGDNRIVYSHIDGETLGASLWVYENGRVSLLHNETRSDDDPYPDKQDPNHIAFIGWQDGGYQLFMYRRDRNDAVQLTRDLPVLAPVPFRPQ